MEGARSCHCFHLEALHDDKSNGGRMWVRNIGRFSDVWSAAAERLRYTPAFEGYAFRILNPAGQEVWFEQVRK